MRAIQICLGILFCLSVFGCSGENKLVGTWEAEGVGPNRIKGTMITFNEDNTYTTSNNLNGKSVSTSGTYELHGETLTITVTKIDGLSEKAQKRNDERLAKNPSKDTSTLEWKSNTEFVMVSTTGRSILKKTG